jgi:hypothetical protein
VKLVVSNGRELEAYDVTGPVYHLAVASVSIKRNGYLLLEDEEARDLVRDLAKVQQCRGGANNCPSNPPAEPTHPSSAPRSSLSPSTRLDLRMAGRHDRKPQTKIGRSYQGQEAYFGPLPLSGRLSRTWERAGTAGAIAGYQARRWSAPLCRLRALATLRRDADRRAGVARPCRMARPRPRRSGPPPKTRRFAMFATR